MIGVGIAGLGWWGRVIADKISGDGRMTLVATADPDPATAATVRSLDELLEREDVDAVILCLPHSTHAEAIVRSAAAGKHVFCEKPLTLTAASARLAVTACQEAGVVLGVGHERRFETPMRRLIETVGDGTLGTVLHAEAAFSHDRFLGLPGDHWRGSPIEAPAAGMTGMGVHLANAFIAMFGGVDEVHAFTARRVLPLPTGDVVSVHLRFGCGVIASASAVSVTPFYGRMAVFGSHGWVELRDDAHPEEMAGGHVTICRRGGVPVTTYVEPGGDAVLANLSAFVDAIEEKAVYPFSAAELVHNAAVLEATAQSASTGKPVRMRGDLSWA